MISPNWNLSGGKTDKVKITYNNDGIRKLVGRFWSIRI